MTEEHKKWSDDSSYEGLLSKWRNAPLGDSMFRGDTGDYYSAVMAEKKAQLSPGEAVQASKNIG